MSTDNNDAAAPATTVNGNANIIIATPLDPEALLTEVDIAILASYASPQLLCPYVWIGHGWLMAVPVPSTVLTSADAPCSAYVLTPKGSDVLRRYHERR